MQMEPDLGFTVRSCEGAKVPSTGLWCPRHLPAAPGVSWSWLMPREQEGLDRRASGLPAVCVSAVKLPASPVRRRARPEAKPGGRATGPSRTKWLRVLGAVSA